MKEALDILSQNIDRDILNEIINNPNKIIMGHEISPFKIVKDFKNPFLKKMSKYFNK